MTQPYSRDEKPFIIRNLLFTSCELLITAIILTYSFINVKYLFALFLTFYLFFLFTFTSIKIRGITRKFCIIPLINSLILERNLPMQRA